VARVRREGVYSIGAVSRMLGVPTQTLRSWEERYGQIRPERSPGGQRLYSRDQVDQLRFVVGELDRGLQPGDAHRLLEGWGRPGTEPRSEQEGAMTVLLAERDPFAANLAEYLLRTEGYGTRIVLTVEAARQVLQGEPLILAVIDLLISGGEGLELCRVIKAHGSLPVVAVSALDSRDEALEAGADAFLLKPLDSLQLVSTVRDLLGTSAYLRRPVGVP
jgi:DNA-binding transcriptional MerR regulator